MRGPNYVTWGWNRKNIRSHKRRRRRATEMSFCNKAAWSKERSGSPAAGNPPANHQYISAMQRWIQMCQIRRLLNFAQVNSHIKECQACTNFSFALFRTPLKVLQLSDHPLLRLLVKIWIHKVVFCPPADTKSCPGTQRKLSLREIAH